jgi:predicted AlkP superfamily pyrophosphatase or phosphodiesterase
MVVSNELAPLSRRRFLQVASAAGLTSILCFHGGCSPFGKGGEARQKSAAAGKKMIVVGIDGFDPRLAERLMDAGELPHLAAMRAAGGYARLGSSVPPQSPVAWANFITGADPGVHGIFDFIHRHPDRGCAPYYAASETVQATQGWKMASTSCR